MLKIQFDLFLFTGLFLNRQTAASTSSTMTDAGEGIQKKRKLPEVSEIEIDVSAPEPPSKKALRKAKKKGAEDPSDATTDKPTGETDPKKEDSAESKRSEYGVWIGNLPFSATKDDLRRFFTTHCSFTETTITRLHMPRPADKNARAQNRGFAYVDFSTAKAATEAMALSEKLLTGRRVLIKDAKNFTGRPQPTEGEDGQKTGATAAAASGPPPSKRIFVGNLGFDTTKEMLEEHLGQCGPITDVHMATFQDSGKCKGYAWVRFQDLAAAEAAVKGFVMVKEDDEDDEEEEEEEKEEEKEEAESTKQRRKPKKPQQRRVWVNNLLGRRMRMEFAEDATTRYNKRYGKGSKTRTKDGERETTGAATGEMPARAKRDKPDYTRYDSDTVQKLSGAIVESKGQKVTFD